MESGGPSVPPAGPAAGVYPPPPGGSPPAKTGPGGGWWAGAVAAVVVALAGGFLFGKSQGENSKADEYKAGASGYDAIYQSGFTAGKTEGEQAGTAAGETAGQQTGKAEGEKAGFEKGKAQGEAQGTAAGASAALGGLTSWDTTAHYIVRVAGGPSDEVPYVISTRTQMQAGDSYALCASDPTVVCVKPQGGSGSE